MLGDLRQTPKSPCNRLKPLLTGLSPSHAYNASTRRTEALRVYLLVRCLVDVALCEMSSAVSMQVQLTRRRMNMLITRGVHPSSSTGLPRGTATLPISFFVAGL